MRYGEYIFLPERRLDTYVTIALALSGRTKRVWLTSHLPSNKRLSCLEQDGDSIGRCSITVERHDQRTVHRKIRRTDKSAARSKETTKACLPYP